jgi:hypothetical protein
MPGRIFDEKELEGRGFFYGVGKCYGYDSFPVEKLNTPISPRENWELFLARKHLCWAPGVTYNDTNFIMPDFIPDNVAQGPGGGYDNMGVKWIPDSNPALPAFIEPGFIRIKNIEEVEDFPYPDVDNWPWADGAKPYEALDQDRMNVAVIMAGMFERMICTFGFDNAAAYFLTDGEYLHKFLDKILDMNCKIIRNFHKYFKPSMIYFHDDWGSQRAQFFSSAIVREFFVPRFRIMADLCHSLGMTFVHHSCGRVGAFVPLMVEYGADVWSLQIDANEDLLPEIVEKYGDRLLFDIVFDNSKASFPEKDDDLKQYIEKQYRLYGKSGRCSISFSDSFEAKRGFDLSRFCYETARKIIN